MRRALVVLLALATVAVFLLGGTSAAAMPRASATLSTTPARAEIARLVTASYPGLPFGNVACPPTVARAVGGAFTCTVQLAGTFLVVDAAQQDRSGNVALSTTQAVLAKAPLEQFVAANASIAATVDCGPAWSVRRPGEQVTCTAALADGTQRTVALTVRDAAGTVTITAVT